MFCRSCRYDLTGLDPSPAGESPTTRLPHACPECGRGFDPADPRTWQPLPRSRFAQFVFGKGGATIVAALLIGVGISQTWIPRPRAVDFTLPRSMRSWTMWHWFSMAFGSDTFLVSGRRMTLRYFAGRVSSVTSHDPRGGETVRVTDLGDGRARVRTLYGGVDHREVIAAVRQLQEWPDQPWFFAPKGRTLSYAPSEFEGTWSELIPAIAGHYRLRLLPMLTDEAAPELWVLAPREPGSDEGDVLQRVSVEQAEAMGLKPTVVPRGTSFGALRLASP